MARRLSAEALGTALLAATVIGSGIMAERLAGGNAALALLANTVATGAMLAVLITIFGPVSGAHLNPAVTLVLALRRALPMREAARYAAAQLLGGAAGAMLANAMFGLPLIEVASRPRTGPAQWLSEMVASFALVITIFGTARAKPAALPGAVALVIVAGYWFTASTSFANPALTLARALSDSFAGIAPAHVPLFILAQLAGALAGLAAARLLFGEDDGLRADTTIENRGPPSRRATR